MMTRGMAAAAISFILVLVGGTALANGPLNVRRTPPPADAEGVFSVRNAAPPGCLSGWGSLTLGTYAFYSYTPFFYDTGGNFDDLVVTNKLSLYPFLSFSLWNRLALFGGVELFVQQAGSGDLFVGEQRLDSPAGAGIASPDFGMSVLLYSSPSAWRLAAAVDVTIPYSSLDGSYTADAGWRVFPQLIADKRFSSSVEGRLSVGPILRTQGTYAEALDIQHELWIGTGLNWAFSPSWTLGAEAYVVPFGFGTTEPDRYPHDSLGAFFSLNLFPSLPKTGHAGTLLGASVGVGSASYGPNVSHHEPLSFVPHVGVKAAHKWCFGCEIKILKVLGILRSGISRCSMLFPGKQFRVWAKNIEKVAQLTVGEIPHEFALVAPPSTTADDCEFPPCAPEDFAPGGPCCAPGPELALIESTASERLPVCTEQNLTLEGRCCDPDTTKVWICPYVEDAPPRVEFKCDEKPPYLIRIIGILDAQRTRVVVKLEGQIVEVGVKRTSSALEVWVSAPGTYSIEISFSDCGECPGVVLTVEVGEDEKEDRCRCFLDDLQGGLSQLFPSEWLTRENEGHRLTFCPSTEHGRVLLDKIDSDAGDACSPQECCLVVCTLFERSVSRETLQPTNDVQKGFVEPLLETLRRIVGQYSRFYRLETLLAVGFSSVIRDENKGKTPDVIGDLKEVNVTLSESRAGLLATTLERSLKELDGKWLGADARTVRKKWFGCRFDPQNCDKVIEWDDKFIEQQRTELILKFSRTR